MSQNPIPNKQVDDFGAAWFQHQTRLARATAISYRSDYIQFKRFCEDQKGVVPEERPTSAFTRLIYKDYMNYQKSLGKKDATISRHLTALDQITFDLHEDGVLLAEPPSCERLRPRKRSRKVGKTLTAEELLKLMDTPLQSSYVYADYLAKRDDAILALANDAPQYSFLAILRMQVENVDITQGVAQIGDDKVRLSLFTITRVKEYLATRDMPSDFLFATTKGTMMNLPLVRGLLKGHASYLNVKVPLQVMTFGEIPEQTRQKLVSTSRLRVADRLRLRDTAIIQSHNWIACRPGELCAVKIEDVDLRHHVIEFTDTKAGITQRLPIPPELEAYYKPLMINRLPTEFLFAGLGGPSLSRRTITGIIKRHAERCGINPDEIIVNPRVIRRSVATLLYHNGADIALIAGGLLRHRDGPYAISRNHYIAQDPYCNQVRPIFEKHPYRCRQAAQNT